MGEGGGRYRSGGERPECSGKTAAPYAESATLCAYTGKEGTSNKLPTLNQRPWKGRFTLNQRPQAAEGMHGKVLGTANQPFSAGALVGHLPRVMPFQRGTATR
jgi:hypothetical protein